MFRPGENPYNNCVVYSDYYYITPYNQYKVLDTLQCPEESKYLVRTNQKSYCIYDCKADENNKYLYNGECLKQCPANTINQNYICKKIVDECYLGEIKMDDKSIINQESTETLVRTYISEFNYTNKYVSLHTNKNYQIIIYKNKDCISELSLEMPKVDFKDCYNKVKRAYRIQEDLIIAIIDKDSKSKSQTYYSFFHPLSGQKLDAENICKNETIAVQQNLTSKLAEDIEKFELQTYLTEQGINIFDMNDPFYTDLCYDFDNPSDKDIPLSERITSVYPDISLCDEGCLMDGIDLESMTALCNCKFNDIANNNVIRDNAILDSVVGEVFDFINSSNILVMKCYKYIFKHFSNSIGGIISLVSLAAHISCSLVYFIYGCNQIKIYIYKIYEKFISFIEKYGIANISYPPKRKIKNETLKSKLTKQKNAPNSNLNKKIDFQNLETHSSNIKNNKNKNQRKIKIEKPPQTNNYDPKETEKQIIIFRENNSKMEKNLIKLNEDENNTKSKNKNKKNLKTKTDSITLMKKDKDYKKFFEEYLATSLDEMEYDDAIIKDQRSFCEYFKECLKEKQMIAFTFISWDPLKIRIIKIMLFILNIILYFVVIGLFYSEEYISTLYNLNDEEENFFSYIPRSIDKYVYTALVGGVIGYIIDCFFVEERKLKGIFKREMDNIENLKSEITEFIINLKKRYLSFIILVFIILLFAFFYFLCFNYVYPKTQVEWVKSSITIFIIMQILSVLKCFLETCLRFMSFYCNSEKLYKLSKFLD